MTLARKLNRSGVEYVGEEASGVENPKSRPERFVVDPGAARPREVRTDLRLL